MKLSDIWQLIISNPGWTAIIITIITTLVEIVPLRFNPWSRLFSWIGRASNKDTYARLDKIDNRLDEIAREGAEQDVLQLRHLIIHDAEEIARLYKENSSVEKNVYMLYYDLVRSYVCLSEKYQIQDGYVMNSIRTVNQLYKQEYKVYLFTEETINEIEQKFKHLANKED